jgi:dienelactone hydrolase
LVPNWLGINPANLKQAELVAGQKYVVFVADMYGKTARPKNMEEAGKAAGAV